jgi:hypothetical protein
MGEKHTLPCKEYWDHPRLNIDLLNALPEEHKDLMRSIIWSYWVCYPIYEEKIRPLMNRCKIEYPGEDKNPYRGLMRRYELINMEPDERREHLLWMKTYWENVKDAHEKGEVLAQALVEDSDNPAAVHGHLLLGQLLYGAVYWWTGSDGKASWDVSGCSPLLADDEVEMVSEKVIPGERREVEERNYGFLRRIEEELKSLPSE